MGNKHNKENPHASRLKYRKHCHCSKKQEAECTLEGSRIINLQQLASFVQSVSAHSKFCKGIISLTGEQYHQELACVLSSGCMMKMSFSNSSNVNGLIKEGEEVGM
jgi:hypothetical protein